MKGIDKKKLSDEEIKAIKDGKDPSRVSSKCFNAKLCRREAVNKLKNEAGTELISCDSPRCEHTGNAQLKIDLKGKRHAKRNRGAEPMRQAMMMQA